MTGATQDLNKPAMVPGPTAAEAGRIAATGEGAMLEALLNATETAVIMIDPKEQVASMNQAAEAMFGFEAGESVAMPIAGLISDEIALAGDEAPTRPSTGNGRRKNGDRFPAEVSRASWIDAHGCTASAAIVRDVTERRRAETAAHTRDKLAALGRIAGGVGHELNNLLQPIIGLAQLELDQLPSQGTPEQIETRDSLAVILESANQAREVVRKLLMFARKAKPELAPVDFPAALGRVIASLGKQLPPQIHLDCAVEPGAAGLANINETELAEVMTQLALNAADAMGGCGTVTIKADRLGSPDRASLGIAAGPAFRVSVIDSGHGIDEKAKAQIFEPFFTTKAIGQGTGLGLSIVYGVLRDWKGAIAVESVAGHGSTFTFYVPVLGTR